MTQEEYLDAVEKLRQKLDAGVISGPEYSEAVENLRYQRDLKRMGSQYTKKEKERMDAVLSIYGDKDAKKGKTAPKKGRDKAWETKKRKGKQREDVKPEYIWRRNKDGKWEKHPVPKKKKKPVSSIDDIRALLEA